MVPDEGGNEPEPEAEGISDDLGLDSDIEALVAAVQSDATPRDFDDDLMGDAELAKLREIADDAAGESGIYAAELDDEGFEELEGEGFEELEGEGFEELEDGRFEELDAAQVVEEPDDDAGPRTLYLEIDEEMVEIDKDRFVIGRASKLCDFAIVDVNISRQHCAIERRGDDYYVVDYGSINGVEVDGKRVDDYRIAEGDELVMASHRIRASFVAPKPAKAHEDAEAEPTSAKPPPVPVASEVEARHTSPLEPVPVEKTPATGVYVASPPRDEPVTVAQPRHLISPGVASSTFEQRVEQRLDQMAQQLAYLQQMVGTLVVRLDELRDVAQLATMIRRRLGSDPKRR